MGMKLKISEKRVITKNCMKMALRMAINLGHPLENDSKRFSGKVQSNPRAGELLNVWRKKKE
jgi:hypothetical protein